MEALYAPRTVGTGGYRGRLAALGRLGDARKHAKKKAKKSLHKLRLRTPPPSFRWTKRCWKRWKMLTSTSSGSRRILRLASSATVAMPINQIRATWGALRQRDLG